MISAVEWIWFFCLLVLTGYHLIIFRRRTAIRLPAMSQWPGVTIIIAHKDHSRFLQKLLPLLHTQDYPEFEVIVVDDFSRTQEKEILSELKKLFPQTKIIPSARPGKKHAIETGITEASHELILCTDADCLPSSDQWIRKMVMARRKNGLVLGYSPLKKKNNFLNLFFRFENIMTAIQYISWAGAGRAFMGVGRNMLYPRTLFLKLKPYEKHNDLPYGDDDLWVQIAARETVVSVCDDPLAHMITEAPDSLADWIRQKHRHMSAGHYYDVASWLKPGMYGICLIFHWSMVPLFILFSFWWQWLPVFLIGMFIRWMTFGIWAARLKDISVAYIFPLLELTYVFHLIATGTMTIFRKKRKWD